MRDLEVVPEPSWHFAPYGVVLERDVPGVVWDELSLTSSFTRRLDYQNAERIADQIRRRDVDLMVFMLGGNDLSREKGDLAKNTDRYEHEYGRVSRKFRAGKPEVNWLIMSLTDHAIKVNGAIVSRNIVARVAAAQRRVADREAARSTTRSRPWAARARSNAGAKPARR